VLDHLSSKIQNKTYNQKPDDVSWTDFIKSRVKDLGDEGTGRRPSYRFF
jgi:hypothetical protein